MSGSREEKIQSIRVMSLGEIVTPNMMTGVSALATLTNNPTNKVLGAIGKLQKEIDSFKLGTLGETDFNNLFIAAITEATGVTITVEQFDAAWSKMNPTYKDFKENLNAAIQYNATQNQKFILVSFTNPKDMRQLLAELKENNITHQTVADEDGNTHLKSIDCIELILTYKEKKTKDELVKQIHERYTNNSSSVFTYDMKYIQGKDKLAPNIMEAILWDKSNCKTLTEFLAAAPVVAVDKTALVL